MLSLLLPLRGLTECPPHRPNRPPAHQNGTVTFVGLPKSMRLTSSGIAPL
jgi:hypothetical protein